MTRRFAALLWAALLAPGGAAAAGAEAPGWFAPAPLSPVCGGECRATVYAGAFNTDSMQGMLLLAEPVWPWEYAWDDGGLVAASAGRRLATLFGRVDLEAEAGLGLHLGGETAGEAWGAIYARWTAFPWNHLVRTSVAVDLGLSWVTDVPSREAARDRHPEGRQLLHFLSPEATFAHPDWRSTEVVLRLHHRSGGGSLWGDSWLFDGVAGGAQYWTLGLRRRF